MFRNSISTTVGGPVVRKVSSVGLLVAGAVGTSPWLRATAPCTSSEYSLCELVCADYGYDLDFCAVGNNGAVYCGCS
jgi:hypothetical protein